MKRKLNTLMSVLTAAALMASPVYAADNVLEADFVRNHYTLDMSMDDFFRIDNLDFGKEYVKTMEIRNDSPKTVKMAMVDVENDLEDTRLYDISDLKVEIDGKTVYEGSMHEARWTKTVAPGKSFIVTYTYSADPGGERHPDNKWMAAEMQSTWVFVGEIEKSVDGGYGGGGSYDPGHNDPDPKPDDDDGDKGEQGGDTVNPDDGSGGQDDGKPGDTDDPDVIVTLPPTGDTTNAGLLSFICAASGTGMIAVSSRKYRNK